MKRNYILIYYSLNDEVLAIFDNYKECAKYFNTTTKVIQCYISRSLRKPNKKKRDIKNKIWGYLVKENIDEKIDL